MDERPLASWTLYIPRPLQSECCPACDQNFEVYNGAMRLKGCRHLYHEPCAARTLNYRASGEIRCLVCHVRIAPKQEQLVRVRKNSDPLTKNTLCWICKFDLCEESPYDVTRECAVTPKRGRIARIGWVRAKMIDTLVLYECEHAYHKVCLEMFLEDVNAGGTRCGKCTGHFGGMDLEYVRFDDEMKATGTVDDEVRVKGIGGSGSNADKSSAGGSAIAQYVSSSGSEDSA